MRSGMTYIFLFKLSTMYCTFKSNARASGNNICRYEMVALFKSYGIGHFLRFVSQMSSPIKMRCTVISRDNISNLRGLSPSSQLHTAIYFKVLSPGDKTLKVKAISLTILLIFQTLTPRD